NLDAFVAAYRAEPRLLHALATDDHHHELLRGVLRRARDYVLAEKFGLAIGPPGLHSIAMNQTLTKREREVLDLLRRGLSNKEIGKTLYISDSTAKVHVLH